MFWLLFTITVPLHIIKYGIPTHYLSATSHNNYTSTTYSLTFFGIAQFTNTQFFSILQLAYVGLVEQN